MSKSLTILSIALPREPLINILNAEGGAGAAAAAIAVGVADIGAEAPATAVPAYASISARSALASAACVSNICAPVPKASAAAALSSPSA
jgi:hypothetical protein